MNISYVQLSDFQEIIKEDQLRILPQLTRRSLPVDCVSESATAIIGGRRCGKTYRSYQFIHDLAASGVPRESVCRFQFNDLRLSRLALDELRMIDTAYYSLYPSFRHTRPVHFIFDEIHRIEGWEDYILYLLDDPNHRVLITGSTSKLQSGEIASALRGKCHPRRLFGFSFREFLSHLGITPDTISSTGQSQLRNAFSRYLVQGGYPELFKFEAQRHVELLQDYWRTMLVRDIVEAHPGEQIPFESLLYFGQSLVSRTARPFTVRRLMTEMHEAGLGCSHPTGYKYLRYLQEAFAVDAVSLFTESTRVRQRNYQKAYALDWALADAVTPTAPVTVSHKLETIVYVELVRRNRIVHYLSTHNDTEIDFITHRMSGQGVDLVQVCQSLTADNYQREVAALPPACRHTGASSATVVTLEDERDIALDGVTVRVVPAWKWLLEE